MHAWHWKTNEIPAIISNVFVLNNSLMHTYVANAVFIIHDGVGSYMWFCITPYLYGVPDARLVVMGKCELVSSAADVTCSGEAIWLVTGVWARQMRSPRVSLGELCWGCSRERTCIREWERWMWIAGVDWFNHSGEIPEWYWKIGFELDINKCCKYVGRDLRWFVRIRTATPASESHARVRQLYQEQTECILCMYKITWLKCILWGNRFPPKCVVGVGEAGASHVNK